MLKVKEYLDKNFFSNMPSTAVLKEDGHYNVLGNWGYPKVQNWKKDTLWLRCNNETIVLDMVIDGKSVSKYGYLQTYSHLPREQADENGFYAQSTDEEIINYIEMFLTIIKNKENI